MPKEEICFPNCHDNVALANDIARYFHRKILNIRKELHGIDVTRKIWNSLPQSLQSQQNFNVFKSLLKTHYFREAFNFFLVFRIVYIFAFYCKFKIVNNSHSNFGFHFNMSSAFDHILLYVNLRYINIKYYYYYNYCYYHYFSAKYRELCP